MLIYNVFTSTRLFSYFSYEEKQKKENINPRPLLPSLDTREENINNISLEITKSPETNESRTKKREAQKQI